MISQEFGWQLCGVNGYNLICVLYIILSRALVEKIRFRTLLPATFSRKPYTILNIFNLVQSVCLSICMFGTLVTGIWLADESMWSHYRCQSSCLGVERGLQQHWTPTAKSSSMCAARAAAFCECSASDGLQATHSRHQDCHRAEQCIDSTQHTAARVWEAREAQPEELLAVILMLTARSEATAATIDVERLGATRQ